MDSSLDESNISLPEIIESRGSSISTTFREEYEELLKHALIAPHITSSIVPSDKYSTPVDVVMSPLKKQPGHSDNYHPFVAPLEFTASEIAPEPTPQPNSFQIESSDLIDLELDVEELTKDSKHLTQTIHKHHVLLTENEPATYQNLTEPHNFNYSDIPDKQKDLSTETMELYRMNDFIDEWSVNFKRNILAEVQQIQTRMNAKVRDSINRTREESVFEINSLQRELESMRELVLRYELSLSHRNSAIDGITRSLSKVRRTCIARKFWGVWREQLAQARCLALKMRLAEQFNVRRVKRRSWEGWRSLIVGKWKARVERACQARAQQVCTQLTAEYELKLATAENALLEARDEVKSLTRDRETYEETMKKAFMRGVCALSMEAMTMFQPQEIVPPHPLPPPSEPEVPTDTQEPPSTTQSAYIPIAKSQKKAHFPATTTTTTTNSSVTKPKEPIYIQSGKRANIAPSRNNKQKVLVERHVHVAH